MKMCTDCLEAKPLNQFRLTTNGARTYSRGQCNTCERTREREQTMFRNFGITQVRYQEMLSEQGGGCAICKTTVPGGTGRFHIDHDHECCPTYVKTCGNCIRGLLCYRCNTVVGTMDDSANLFISAAAYLITASAKALVSNEGSSLGDN